MIPIKESIKYGWQKLKENMELALYATLMILAVSALTGQAGGKHAGIVIPLNILALVFLTIAKIGYNKIFLKIHDGEKPKFVEIFEHYKIFWRYIGVSILFALITIGGLILLILPGIFWFVRFYFAPLVVIDTKIGPVAALKESYAITKGNFWKLLLFLIVLLLLNLAGVILFWIGLLVTVPITTFASIYVYRKLSREKAGLAESASPQVA